jgi:hypothetical protein
MNKFYLPLNLQHFAEEQGEETTEQQVDQPTAESQTTETKEPPKEEAKTIPYDRFKQVNDDLKTFKSTFEELGLDGVDGLKSLITDYNAKKQAEEERAREEMTELDRLKADLTAKEQAELTLKQQLEQTQESIKQRDIKDAFRKVATSAEYGIPPERLEAAYKLADISAVNVSENGVEGIEDVVKALVEHNDFLVAKQQKEAKSVGGPSNPNAQSEVKTLESQLEDAKKKKDFGKVIELSNKIKQALS